MSFNEFLARGTKAPLITTSNCHAICLQPCNHVIGKECLEAWMNVPDNATGGLCPYCRQSLLTKSRGIVEEIKHYVSNSPVSLVPDILAAILIESHPGHADIDTETLNEQRVLVAFLLVVLVL